MQDKVNILLVDDQPAKLLSYEVMLGELGENLIKAESASEAFSHLLKHDIAVVLIDVCMPELDGFQLATMIREHPRFQKTAIIFVSAIQFSAPPPPPPPTPPPAPAPAPAVAAGAVTLAAGTVLTVRMDTQVSSQDAGGKKFSGKLVADLSDGRTAAAKAGATVLGQVGQSKQAGRLAGKSELDISLVSLDVSGTLVPIMTTNFAETGKSSFRKTARNATAGAVIGNQVADDNGGGKGAAVGVGVSLIRKGDSVTVPPGAILEFRLTQPVTITPKP